ncbi:MAG: HepT-like ribonuclease domain-containing protein [Armatimonadota bacterium]
MRQYAILHAVEIIGEAAAKVSPEYRSSHPEIPWRDIVGMRNHLVHAYFDIDIPLTWKTVTEDIPQLIETLKKLL